MITLGVPLGDSIYNGKSKMLSPFTQNLSNSLKESLYLTYIHKGALSIKLREWGESRFYYPLHQNPSVNPNLLEYSHLRGTILITGRLFSS